MRRLWHVKNGRGRRCVAALIGAAAALAAPTAASGQILSSPLTPRPATPDLIDRAQERGTIDLERASLYRVYALSDDPRLPAAYESTRPWRGTLLDLRLRRDLPKLDPGPEKRAVTEAMRAPADPNPTTCSTSVAPPPDSIETAHFYIQYNDSVLIGGGLDIQDYADSLEEVYAVEVDDYDWAGPPQTAAAASAIPGKYHVRVEPLGAGLYGFVSNTGTYAGTPPGGNNPNTTWADGDARASCMVLNSDFDTGFPGTPQQALDATTAHEYNHSIQFGYGALNGSNAPDDNFIEGGATWMEDEAQDAADDSYNYLYPEFDDSMGEYDEGDIYAYWLTWRGLTERYGAGTASGGEQLMQDFWEITSQNTGDTLTAMQQAVAAQGTTTLAGSYHDYAVAAKMMRPCTGGYSLPYCFEEATGYRNAAGEPASHGSIGTIGGSFASGSVEDNYTLNWVDLPINGTFNLNLANTSSGGQLRATVACDTGSAVAVAAFPATVGAGQNTTISGLDPTACDRAVAVITNEAQTAANPASSTARSYSLTTSPAAAAVEPVVPPDTIPADTKITSGPASTTASPSSSFEFSASEASSTFECQFQSSAWEACTSPFAVGPLVEGTYVFRVRATDPSGNQDPTPASRTFTVDFSPPAGGGGSPGPTSGNPTPVTPTARDTARPVIRSLRLSGRRFRAARSGAAIRAAAPLGTRVGYRLNEPAAVTVRYERKTTGRRVGGRCRATTRTNVRRSKCTRWVLVRGAARHGGKAGANAFRLTGRMRGRAVRVGVYRLRLSARDAARNTSRLRRSPSFRIVRR